MEFEIRAKYQALADMRKELEATKRKLVEMDEAADPDQWEKLEKRAVELSSKMGDLQNELDTTTSRLRGKMTQALKSAEEQAGRYYEKVNRLATANYALKKKLETANEEMEKSKKAYDDAVNSNSRSQAELDGLKKRLDATTAKYAKLSEELTKNTEKLDDNRLHLIKAQTEMGKAKSSLAEVDEEGEKVGESSNDAAVGLAKLAAVTAGAVGLKQFTQQCINARMQMQGMQTSLETMVGKDTAQSLFDQLFVIAKKSPLEMTDMVRAEQMMISFGINAQDSIKYLNALSDISMGNAGKFNSLTLAFSQMSATGKLMGQDLNQMINQGFNPLEVIATKTGKSIAQLKDEMSKGKITAKMVQDAFISCTQEGGRFYNMSAAASKTLQGQMSMLEDALTNMYSTIGEKLEPWTMSLYQTATKVAENWEEVIPIFLSVAGAVGAAKVAFLVHTAAVKANAAAQAAGQIADMGRVGSLRTLMATIWQGSAAQRAWNAAIAACPYVLIGAAIATLGYALYKAATHMTEAEKAQEALSEAMSEADKEADKECSKLLELDATLKRLDESSAEYASTKRQMVEMAKKWDAAAASEIERNGLTVESYTKLNEAVQKHYRVKAYLRWKDAEDARRQEMIQESISTIRQNLTERYVDKADGKEERTRRAMEVNKAIGEIAKQVYGGTLQYEGKENVFESGDSVGNVLQNVMAVAIPAFGLYRSFKSQTSEARTNLSKETAELIQKGDAFGFWADDVDDLMDELASNVAGMNSVLSDEGNMAMFGLTKEDVEKESKKQAEEKEKAAREKAKKDKKASQAPESSKEKKEKEKKKKEQEDAKKKIEESDASIRKGWSEQELRDEADEYIKRKKEITASYDDRVKVVTEQEERIKAALKSGALTEAEANEKRATLAKETVKIEEDKAKALIKLNEEVLKETADPVIEKSREYEGRRDATRKSYAAGRAKLESVIKDDSSTEEQKSRARAGVDLLGTQERHDLAKIDLEEFKGGDLYTKLFQNLGDLGNKTLAMLRERMVEFGDSVRANLSPADAQAFEDALIRLEDEMAERDPWGAYASARDAMGDALERKVAATEELARAEEELRSVRSSLDKESKKEVKDTKKIVALQERLAVVQSDYTKTLVKLAKAEDDEKKAKNQAAVSAKNVISTFKELVSVSREVTDALGVDAGNVYSFVTSILDFGTTAIDTFAKTSEATTAAMQAAETASVVLAIAGAAIRVLTALSKFFEKDDDDTKAYKKAVEAQQEVNKMADAVSSYTRAVEEAQRAENSWFSSSGLSGMRDSWDSATSALDAYNEKANQQQVKYQNEKGKRSGFAKVVRALATGGSVGSWVEAVNSDKSSGGGVSYVSAVDNLRFETRKAKKGGIFKKAKDQKTVDLRTWAKDTYGSDLFDENNMIDVEMAQNIIDTYGDKLVGETKATLESLIEQAEAYNEAMDEIKSSVADMFSPMVDNLTDAVWNWLETGEDALDTFRESASDTFKSIAQNMIKTLANKLIFQSYSEQVEELGEKYAKGEITEEELMTQALDMTDATLQGSESAIKTMQEMTQKVSDYAKSMGYDMTGSSEVSASGGGFETMSEDTATELSGRFTALYESGLRQEALLGKVTEGLSTGGGIAALTLSMINVTSAGFSSLVAQAQAGNVVLTGISDCLAQSYVTLMEISETASKQEKHLATIKAEVVKVRKVTDTL